VVESFEKRGREAAIMSRDAFGLTAKSAEMLEPALDHFWARFEVRPKVLPKLAATYTLAPLPPPAVLSRTA
jgi:hypothetical protein